MVGDALGQGVDPGGVLLAGGGAPAEYCEQSRPGTLYATVTGTRFSIAALAWSFAMSFVVCSGSAVPVNHWATGYEAIAAIAAASVLSPPEVARDCLAALLAGST